MSDFVDLYHHSYRGLARQLSAYLGDPAEAEDVVQEAYLRAWQRWDDIGRYDDPVAWVRRVAWNLATSRGRRMAVAARHLLRQPPAEPVAGTNPDHVALVAALRDLPDTHRRAVVLHYLGDLSAEEIAVQLGVPRGTVLSWLHRSRQRLADLLSDEATRSSAAPPPASRIVARARRRRTTRLATAIAALFAGATAAAVAVPAIMASLPTPANRIENVSWDRGSITLPGRTDDTRTCPPAGRHTIESGTARGTGVPGGIGHIAGDDDVNSQKTEIWIDGRHPAYADLTGDGVAEAILRVTCGDAGPDRDGGNQFGQHLLVVGRNGGRLVALGNLGPANARVIDYRVEAGQLIARFKVDYLTFGDSVKSVDSPTHQRVYAWNGTAMVQAGGRTRALALPAASRGSDVTEFAAIRKDGVTLCPARTEYGSLPPDGGYYHHHRPDPQEQHAAEIDIDDDGESEMLAFFSCENVSSPCPSLFLFQQGSDRFVTLDVPLPNGGTFTVDNDLTVSGHSFSVTIRDSDTRTPQRITMTWDGTKFVRT